MIEITDIFEKSNSFEKPLLIGDFFDDDFLNERDVFSLLESISNDPGNFKNSSVRVYVEDGLNPKFEDQVKFSGISEFSTIQSWVTSVFREKRFGIIVNRAERWNEKISLNVRKYLHPLIEKFDGRFELEITLFIGNYGYTPFGFHIDDEDTSVLHFHVGPGVKDLYLLDKISFQEHKTSLANRCFDYDKLIPLAQKYTIESNSLFVLPSNLYHVGYTPDLSIGLALAVIDTSEKRRIQNAIQANAEKFTMNQNTPFGDFLNNIYENHYYTKKSNGYYQIAPTPRCYADVDYDSVIFSSPYYPILSKRMKEYLVVFARGVEIEMKYAECVEELIHQLSNSDEHRVIDLVEHYSELMEAKAILKIIETLIHLRAINVK